ncbi:MAG TPA: acetoacetate decarboxylase family protein [Dehalococcoidia bacterium]|nr:acetoacetate decarboxylase family protein [Dehalococcoidia bacterium]
MPDYGRLGKDTLPHTTPITSPLYPPPPWRLPGARILKLLFETDKDAVLSWLPPTLSRSSPPYGVIIVAHYPESPVGPFSLAAQYVGCRARLFIRAFALQAVVDNERALTALREVWGLPCRLGRVRLAAGPRGVSARVAAGGAIVAELSLRRPESVNPALIRFDPVLSVRMLPNARADGGHALLEMLQIDPDYEIKEAFRGRGSLRYPAASEGAPWHLFPPLNVVATTYCVADTELPLARFVLPY